MQKKSKVKNGRFNKVSLLIIALMFTILVTGCNTESASLKNTSTEVYASEGVENQVVEVTETTDVTTTVADETVIELNNDITIIDDHLTFRNKQYKIIEVDGGNLSGDREPNVAVDIGFGDRVYWALTNEYSQLVYVIADKITLQDEETEEVKSNGRYYWDEAKVPGTEHSNLDEGHVIADSLGGVSNAYNITPQESTLNRHGDQAYMEKVIRDANGCEKFIATITYADTVTHIPSNYNYEYILLGNLIVDNFNNVNPTTEVLVLEKDSMPKSEVVEQPKANNTTTVQNQPTDASFNEAEELKRIDTNGNGTVTIAEAKAAGYEMPIYSTHWLYKYMIDRNKDGRVGE